MTLAIRLFLLTSCLIFTLSAYAQPEWQKIKDENGILVYSAAVSGSNIIKVKTVVIINAPLTHIRKILDDAPRRTQWVPYLDLSNVLKCISKTERLEYSHFDAPWPISDRDFVFRIRLQHKQKNKLVFSMESEQSPLRPTQPGIIRANLIKSIYTLIALRPRQTRVELIFQADLRGWLPDWMMNIVQRHLPFLMLKNLRAQATAPVSKHM